MHQTAFLAFFGRQFSTYRNGRPIPWPLSDGERARLSELAGTIDLRSSHRSAVAQGIAILTVWLVLSAVFVALVILLLPLLPDLQLKAGDPIPYQLPMLVLSFVIVMMIAWILFSLRLSAAFAPTADMRAKLVPQPGDGPLAAKLSRGVTLFLLKYLTAGALLLMAMLVLLMMDFS